MKEKIKKIKIAMIKWIKDLFKDPLPTIANSATWILVFVAIVDLNFQFIVEWNGFDGSFSGIQNLISIISKTNFLSKWIVPLIVCCVAKEWEARVPKEKHQEIVKNSIESIAKASLNYFGEVLQEQKLISREYQSISEGRGNLLSDLNKSFENFVSETVFILKNKSEEEKKNFLHESENLLEEMKNERGRKLAEILFAEEKKNKKQANS